MTKDVQIKSSRMSCQTFGEYLRYLREQQGFPLRKVAAVLDIDPSTLSKIEKGDRVANKTMVALLATLFNVESEKLNLILVSDKIALELLNEADADRIVTEAIKKIKYLKARNVSQGILNLIND